jgi:transposase
MSKSKRKSDEQTPPQPRKPNPIRRLAKEVRLQQEEQEAQQRIMTLPVLNHHAAGIDVGDRTHWVCVEKTPDGSPPIREFPAHTPGLRGLVEWLRQCGVTTVALEASGVYGQVLFLHLIEAGFQAVLTAPQFARQIKGRPKTDRLDCQWIQRLHTLGFLPRVFQPDEKTQTLRDYVRQRANHVRLSGQHIQRMQKALLLMNLKLTSVLGDVTGVTGLRIIEAILRGVRDPKALAKLRDRRCQKSADEIALALDGRYRDEHVLELKLCYQMWQSYQKVIAALDGAIEQHLRTMALSDLPPLPPKPRVRGKKPHDPKFDVRKALYLLVGIDLTVIEGIDEINALTLVSELGTDFSKWPSGKHFASWLGLCPHFQKTGGKVKRSPTRKGKNRAAIALRLAAQSLLRSKSGWGAYTRRQCYRLGKPKGFTAVAHKLSRIVYHLMRYGVEYLKQTEAEFEAQHRERQEKNLHRKARQFGYRLEKITRPPESQPEGEAK